MIRLILFASLWVGLAAGSAKAQSLPGTPSSPADSTLKKVKFEKTYRVAANNRLEINCTAPATLTITGWDRNEILIKVEMEGKHLQVTHRQESGAVLLTTGYGQYDRAPFARGTVEIKVPKRLTVRGNLASGEVTVSDLSGETFIETGLGSITGINMNGNVFLNTLNGYLHLQGGNLQGQVSAGQGGVLVKQTRGKFSAMGPAGGFTVQSPSEPVEAKIEADSVVLSVKEGDVQADTHQGKLNVSWNGHKATKQRNIQLTAQQSDVVLHLPDGFGVDAFVEQVRSEETKPAQTEQAAKLAVSDAAPVGEPGPQDPAYVYQWKGKYQYNHHYTYSFESDYEWKDFPSEKDFAHQGRKEHLVQARKSFAGGGNQVDIRTVDSRVVLKKQ